MKDSDTDLQELRRMLLVPAERDFPAGRIRQREEHMVNSLLEMSRRKKRKRIAAYLVVPMYRWAIAGGALAAGLVAAVSSTLLGATAVPAYAVTSDSEGVTVTMKADGGSLDASALERDMTNAGMPTRVVGLEACGFSTDEVTRALSANAERDSSAPRPGAVPTSNRKPALIMRVSAARQGQPADVSFTVFRDRVPVGRTLVLYLSQDAKPAAPVGSEVVKLAADWKPCTSLTR